MKRILFPTDLSAAAANAFIYALHVADKTGAAITTLHVYRRPEVKAASLPHTLEEFYASYDLEEFQNYKDSIPALNDIQKASGFAHLEVNHMLKSGKPVEAILRAAEEEKADMIIMGTTGATGLKKIFLGSVAGEVLEKAACPVLAIPERTVFDGQIDRIAFTTSYKEEEKKALEKAMEIFDPFHPLIHCINVDLAHTDFQTHAMDKFKEGLSQGSHLQFHVLDGTDIKEVISRFLRENDIDILAMVTHKRSFLEGLFNYSNAKMMSYHADTPILSIQAHTL
ncbi:MAG: universal stress protein [Phaeodactylibacter sp.]|nr:universal stress protein [Phaeodactylibacter sp.]MCB9274583.1 universal stress protein [Lewinellaceae bacterium]